MAWKFTIHRQNPLHALSVIDINDNFCEVIEEMGSLNEHNWTSRSFYRVDGFDVTDGIALNTAYELNQTAVVKNPNRDLESDFGTTSPLDPNELGFEVPMSGTWERVPMQTGATGGAMVVTCRGGMLWIMASFQHSSATDWFGFPLAQLHLGVLLYPFYADIHRFPIETPARGLEYALRVDGAIIPESILGSGESSVQDPTALRVRKDDGGPYGNVRGSTRGCIGERLPCVVEALIPISSGKHTVELVARSVGEPSSSGDTALTMNTFIAGWNAAGTAAEAIYVPIPFNWCTNRELIVLEISR